MNSPYVVIQVISWSLLYLLLALAISQRPVFVHTELLYAAVLVGSTAIGSHVLHRLFQLKQLQCTLLRQVLLLFAGSAVFAALAALTLVLTVFALSVTGVTFPIPAEQRWFVINSVFLGNFINMLLALWLWSAIYFAIIKVQQLRQTTALLQQTQLDALLSQLNPHFLFNVINNIRALILEDPERARTMLANLSDMLRYSLNPQQGVKVTLQQELETVRSYIDLCSIQFEQRLRYQEQIDASCQQALVPKLLLQLGVENAIKHGIGPSAEGGDIRLSVQCDNAMLQLEIINPGQLKPTDRPTAGVGLSNIRHRLHLLYHGQAQCTLTQQAQQVVLQIVLPLEYS